MSTTNSQLSVIRKTVEEHPLSVALVYIDTPPDLKNVVDIADVEFEWFDNLDKAEEYMEDLATWATKEAEDVGNCKFATVLFKTGKDMEVIDVGVFGYKSQPWIEFLKEAFATQAEKLFFTAEVLDFTVKAKKAPAKKAGTTKAAAPKMPTLKAPPAEPVVGSNDDKVIDAPLFKKKSKPVKAAAKGIVKTPDTDAPAVRVRPGRPKIGVGITAGDKAPKPVVRGRKPKVAS